MALIDRKALIDSFCSQCTVDKPETCSTLRYGDKWCNEVYTILNAPTVDAVPVKHGRWIHHKGGYSDHYECTVCGKSIVLTAKWDFCPMCGARMDLKDGDA